MKLNFKNIALGLVLTGGFVGNAMAIGTQAATSVDNIATLTFDSGSETGQTLNSSPGGNSILDEGNGGAEDGVATTFVVDRKLDVEVDETTNDEVAVTDGSEGFLTFDITNNGNADQDVVLTVIADPSSGNPFTANADNSDMTNVQVCYTGGGGSSAGGTLTGVTCSPIAGPATITIPTLAHDSVTPTPITAYIVGFANGLAAGDRAIYALVAQPAELGGATIEADDRGTADNPAAMDDVFADGAGTVTTGNTSFNDGAITANSADTIENGQHSDTGVFFVEVVELSLQKESEVVWDAFSCSEAAAPTDSTETVATLCGTGNPKAIPGAYVRYTLTITNGGNLEATDASIADTVDTDTDLVPASITVEDGGGDVVDPVPATGASTATDLSVTGITIAESGAADGDDVIVITYFVTIK